MVWGGTLPSGVSVVRHQEPSEIRSELARRVTERAARMREPGPPVIVPVAGDPDPRNMSRTEWRQFVDDGEALRLASRHRTLRVRQRSTNSFYPFPGGGDTARVADVHRSTIQRLVDQGKLEWVNSLHTAAVVTERGKRG